jgi:hypothetical protein
MVPDLVDLDQQLIAAPQASIDHAGFRIAWPHGGLPVALDLAASTVLDLFAEPLSAREVADDLVAAIGLDWETAMQSASTVTTSLLQTGHLIPEGLVPMPAAHLAYPPSASP